MLVALGIDILLPRMMSCVENLCTSALSELVEDFKNHTGATTCLQETTGVTMQEKNLSCHSCSPKLSYETPGRDGHIPNCELLGIFLVKKVFFFVQALEGSVGCQMCSQWIAQVCSVSCVMQSSRDAG